MRQEPTLCVDLWWQISTCVGMEYSGILIFMNSVFLSRDVAPELLRPGGHEIHRGSVNALNALRHPLSQWWDILLSVSTLHGKFISTGKFIACQSLDNRICIYMVGDRFKEMRKKVQSCCFAICEQLDRKLVQVFKGHMVAGYACGLDFSPEMSYLCR